MEKKDAFEEQKHSKDDNAEEELMTQRFTEKELEKGIRQLRKKSPGPDGITLKCYSTLDHLQRRFF